MPIVSPSLPARLINEFTVNSNPVDIGSPTVAGIEDGRFLVVWSGLLNGSDESDPSNVSDIVGRVFAAGAHPVTDDFRINRELRDSQVGPSAIGSEGRFIVGYSSGEENRLYGTYAASQVLLPDGSFLGPENFNHYSNYNNGVDTSGLGDTRFVVTSTQEYSFEAQVREADGTLIRDFRFGGLLSQGRSSVVQTGDGTFQLFWVGLPSDGSEPSEDAIGLYTQSATEAGVVGEPVRLADYAASVDAARLTNGDIVVGGAIYDPTTRQLIGGVSRIGAVAALDDGGFVQVVTAGDGDGSGVFAQIYEADGSARGSRFMVNEVTAGQQVDPDVAAIGGDDFVVTWRGADGIKAAAFSADAPPPEDAILVNTSTQGTQQRPAVTRLTDGGFVVTWQDTARIGSGPGAEVRAQVFDALGHKVGAEILVNGPQIGEPPVDDFAPDVTATRDGGFTIAWSHGDDDLEPAPNTVYQHFSADGTRLGPEVDIPGGFATNTRVAAIGGGRTVVTYREEDSQTFIVGDIYKGNGVPAGHFAIDDRWALSDYDLAALAGGGFVLTYAAPDEPFADEPRKIHAATYATTSALVSDLVVTAPTGHDQFDPAVAALDGNRYVVVWSQDDGSGLVEYAQVLRSDGLKIGDVIEVGTGSADTDVAALPDQRFVVTWTSGTGGAETIHSQVFTQEGDRSGAEETHVVQRDTTVPAFETDVAVSGAGERGYVIAFTGSGTSGDGSGTGIRAETYTSDPLITGSAASETLAGGPAADTIRAGLGDDTVEGHDGNDLIYAEGGVDTVHGGSGADLVYGGGQYDVLFGNDGADTIVGETRSITTSSRAGYDTIEGGNGDDALYGDAYTIDPGGFGGRDTIRGGAGNDTIWGDARTLASDARAGNDTIDGGAGHDVIYGDGQIDEGAAGGNDRITGGAGADDLWGGGGDDVFVYPSSDFGDDTIHDFAQTGGNRDRIDLRGHGLSFDDLRIDYGDGNAIVFVPGFSDGSIEIFNVGQLSKIDFIF